MCARVSILALTLFLLIASAGCRCQRNYVATTRPARPSPAAEERERLIAAQRSQYEELQGQLASMKLEIEDHIRVYELAQDAEDPLNSREDPTALGRIIDASRALHEKSASALAVDREVFRYVKGSARTLRDYKTFAESVLAKYEQRQTGDAAVEASSVPAEYDAHGAPSSDSNEP